jgi:hypothetical protein
LRAGRPRATIARVEPEMFETLVVRILFNLSVNLAAVAINVEAIRDRLESDDARRDDDQEELPEP